MKKNLFYDLGCINTKRKNYKNTKYVLYGEILAKYSPNGTIVYSESDKEGFFYIDKELDVDLNYEFSFKWVGGNFITPIIQIREVSNMDKFITFQKQNTNEWQIYTNFNDKDVIDFKGTKSFSFLQLNINVEIKVIKSKDNIKVYCDNKIVIEYDIKLNSNFYIGFGGHSYGGRYTIFKEVMLREIK